MFSFVGPMLRPAVSFGRSSGNVQGHIIVSRQIKSFNNRYRYMACGHVPTCLSAMQQRVAGYLI